MTRGIQESDVWDAADSLLVAGERPTIERVRQKIGRGSPNTVSPMLDTWFKDLGTRLAGSCSAAASREVPDPVGQAARHLWQVAQSLAGEEASETFMEQRSALSAEQQRLASVEADLHAREQAFEARAAAFEETLTLSRDQLEAAGTRTTALEAAIRGLQENLSEARRLELELRAELAASRALLEGERSQADERRRLFDERLEQGSRRAALEIDQAREHAKQADAELHGVRDELRSVRSELIDTSQRLMKADAEIQAALRDAAESRRIQTELSAQGEAQRVSMARLERALAECQRLLMVKDEEHGLLLKQLVASVGSAGKSTRERTSQTRNI